MILKCLGSSSSGNCYLLDDGKGILIIEAGLPFKEVKEAINYEVSRIVGVLSSHEHQDHRKYLYKYEAAGITCAKGNKLKDIDCKFDLIRGSSFILGDFWVSPFEVPHDVPCFGYQIEHKDMGKLVFVTDAEYVKYKFPNVNHIMVEANYSQEILDENTASGEIPKYLRDRIMKSHMSFDTSKDMVEANKSHDLRNVILCHLSTRNSNKKQFKAEMQAIVGSWCNVEVATKGLELELSKYPF